ncbi:MAG TPA: hypothetical protein VE890_13270, partial [Thermoguttaceae bacterium]|nr:hypothetical protein [Thermoguttaceae bacterium]
DTLYGGGGIDLIIGDVSPLYTEFGDTIDGHYGNDLRDDITDDNATDILLVLGTPVVADTILVGQTAADRPDARERGLLHFDYNGRDIFMPWREPINPDGTLNTPLVEQIRIAGLSGDDRIEFRRSDGLDNGGLDVEPLDLGDLIARSDDYVGVLDGGPGNDTLLGSEARDRIDGGNGSDVIYGFGGNDRLWGNSGTTGAPSEQDVLFGGQGADDLIGGPGENQLFSWTFDPNPMLTQLHVFKDQTATGTASTPAVIEGYAAAVDDGRLRSNMHFSLELNEGDAVPISVLADETTAFTTLDELVALINSKLDASPLAGLVEAGTTPAGDDDLFTLASVDDAATLTLRLPQFGVYVGPDGLLRNDNGDLDGDGLNDLDGTSVLYAREQTGLDRMLGSEQDDELFGGTTVGFLFGNGGDDLLFRADGSLFESMDGGVLGNDWKEYAKETGQVWYVSGSGADDVITVDYVTEPGPLRNKHVVTRLTDNNGDYSYAAQLKLDFAATDGDGNPIWNPEDLTFDIDQVVDAESALLGHDAETLVPYVDPATLTPEEKLLRQQELAQLAFDRLSLEESLLPPEADYEVILIDALGGNDQIYVGPTVQRTVWIDAGDGDDLVRIASGNTILVDMAEAAGRNDLADYAYRIGDSEGLDGSMTLEGLTLDNPEDIDWYRFTLGADAASDAQILATGVSDLDGLTLELYEVDEDGDTTPVGSYATLVSEDGLDLADDANTLETAYRFVDEQAIQNVFRVRGLTIDHGPNLADPGDLGDLDWFRFTLNEPGGEDDAISLVTDLASVDSLELELFDADGVSLGKADKTADLTLTMNLENQEVGDYYVRVRSLGAPARYELVAHVGVGDDPATESFDERRYLGHLVLDLSGESRGVLDIPD